MIARDQVAVLVDAGYLFKAGGQALAGRPIKRDETQLDVPKVVAALIAEATARAPHARLLRIYWYDGIRGSLSGSNLLLAESECVKLRLGTLNAAGEQKQVDPLIITDLMSLSQKGAVSDFVLLSGDADLLIGVQFAQEFGTRVHLRTITPTRGNTSADLRHAADTVAEWSAIDLTSFLRFAPRAVTPPLLTMPAEGATESARSSASGASHIAPSMSVSSFIPGAVVDSVLPTLNLRELREFARGQPGRVPGNVNNRLLGVAKSMNGGFLLSEEEKRELRRLMYEAAMKQIATQEK